jgi:hypothetical protein
MGSGFPVVDHAFLTGSDSDLLGIGRRQDEAHRQR